ncbi:heavy metal translocating P-type ATPase [Segnochrobactraceae bacterium EtOH-i3]
MNAHIRDWDAFSVPADEGRRRIELAVEGITCAACIGDIERGLMGVDGVVKARVNYTNHRVAAVYDTALTTGTAVVDRLTALGYIAHPFDPGRADDLDAAERRLLMRCLGVAGFAAMNVMLLSISVWSGNVTDITPETRDLFHWISALIAMPAVAYAGRPFFSAAWKSVKVGRLSMDVPISLGVILAVGLSLFATVTSAEHAYYDSALMLLFFLLCGRYLDVAMRRRTRAFAENLAALRSDVAAVIDINGRVREMPLSRVSPGDRVLVAPGERLPVDGVVESGASEIDHSLVTGETDPAPVGPGTVVHAGALNGPGQLVVRVAAAGEGTLLDTVNRLLDGAMTARSRTVKLADRVSRAYAPVVHLTAIFTLVGWLMLGADWIHALTIAITVLIITCPCALALAVPAVQVVASGAFFQRGILLNAGDALERFADIDTVVFDKTGTLTLPDARVAGVEKLDAGLRTVAISLARASRHPAARPIADLDPLVPAALDVTEETGRGVRAIIDGREARLGSLAFVGAEAAALAAVAPGATLVAVRHGDGPAVVLGVGQVLRPDAVETVAALRADGRRLLILSGDRPEAVAPVAAALGITEFVGGIAPTDKIARIEALKAEGRRVLMVGDGLNDAPALAAATVSISPVTAAHVSQAAADAVFLGTKLAPVRDALTVGARARRIMMENLAFAVLYNFVAVPLAILGHATPLVAAVAMSGSSLVVTLNALRARSGLRREEVPS